MAFLNINHRWCVDLRGGGKNCKPMVAHHFVPGSE
jgi:hypothetical protein